TTINAERAEPADFLLRMFCEFRGFCVDRRVQWVGVGPKGQGESSLQCGQVSISLVDTACRARAQHAASKDSGMAHISIRTEIPGPESRTLMRRRNAA